MSADGGDYGVGYGKPPHETRFKPGQSGNPKGRPKGKSNYNDDLMKAFNKKVIVVENGRRKALSKWKIACTQLANDAASGDLHAVRLTTKLFDRAGLWTSSDEPSSTSTSEPTSPSEPKPDWSVLSIAELEFLKEIANKLKIPFSHSPQT